jgi:Na+/H+-dicarboxylate symporter
MQRRPAGGEIVTRSIRILLALGVGLIIGIVGALMAWPILGTVTGFAGLVGGLWVDALRMTIIPLVFSLVVSGIVAASSAARAGGIAGRSLILFVLMLTGSALVTALLAPPLLALWTPPAGAIAAVRASLVGSGGVAPVVPPLAEGLRAMVPVNLVASAANDAIVPLVLFALLFGLAAARIEEVGREAIRGFFRAVADAMLVIVHWVLALAPIGVFALALVVGARLGLGAGAVLGHYIGVQIVVALVLTLLMYPLAAIAGRTAPRVFARAALPAQVVAASTQSSIASLPPMLESAERLGLPEPIYGLVLPLAVATFKITAPSGSLIVGLALAHLSGVAVGPMQLAAAVLLAIVSTLAVVGLPGQASFFAAMAPPALALGAPIDLLPLLLAIDTIPDIFRTIANVTADLAATLVVARGRGSAGTPPPSN